MTYTRILLLPIALFLLIQATFGQNHTDDAIWDALQQGGYVVLMRHALAPGTGDPAHFQIGDCSTQRNLNETGRNQARATGAMFRRHGIDSMRVLSSQWCRCRETAELLDLGPVEDFPVLNSFFEDRSSGPAQTAELRAFIEQLPGSGENLFMVTHQVNITALTGVYPSSGEIVVVKPGGPEGLQVFATIAPR